MKSLIKKLGKESVVILPLKVYEDLIEELEMLRSEPLRKKVKKAREEFKKGKYYTLEEIEKLLST